MEKFRIGVVWWTNDISKFNSNDMILFFLNQLIICDNLLESQVRIGYFVFFHRFYKEWF